MKRKIICLGIISLFLLSGIATFSEGTKLNTVANEIQTNGESDLISLSRTIYVDDDAPPDWYDETHVLTIKEGAKAASDGDTVFVFSGTYTQGVKIDRKNINFIGESNKTTIIEGTRIHIWHTTKRVNVRNFTFRNKGSGQSIYLYNCRDVMIADNIFLDNDYGIVSCESKRTIITNNFFSNNNRGIVTNGEKDSYIIGNTFLNNGWSILVDGDSRGVTVSDNIINKDITILRGSLGISICFSDYNIITNNFVSTKGNGIKLNHANNNSIINNTISVNRDCGMWIELHSDYNIIKNNTISDSFNGIYSWVCNFNIIIDNIISKNTHGIWLDHTMDSIDRYANNTISGNTISKNTFGIKLDEKSDVYTIRNLKNNNIFSLNLIDVLIGSKSICRNRPFSLVRLLPIILNFSNRSLADYKILIKST